METRAIIAFALLVLLAGCFGDSRRMYSADGSKVYYVTCDQNHTVDCYKDAGDICKTKGYSLVSPLPGMAFYGGLLIQCKE